MSSRKQTEAQKRSRAARTAARKISAGRARADRGPRRAPIGGFYTPAPAPPCPWVKTPQTDLWGNEVSDTYTPCELSSPNPPVIRAMIARLDVLLTKHYPGLYPDWAAYMEREGKGRETSPDWMQQVAYIAGLWSVGVTDPVLLLGGKGKLSKEEMWSESFQRRVHRNRMLLLRLVFRQVMEQINVAVQKEKEPN